MKIRNIILLGLLVLIGLGSCKSDSATKELINYQCPMQCEGDLVRHQPGSCSICKMDIVPVSELSNKVLVDTPLSAEEISENSIFNLTTKWKTEEDKTIELKDLKGKTLVMVMIYTTCKAACPRLVADMRNIEGKIPEENLKNIQFVLISIDPETDNPKVLKEFAKKNFMDEDQWTFLQGNVSGVREFANVLAVKYKEISPLDFSHSNIISVFDQGGELVHQQEGLGVDNKETIEKIIETAGE